MRASVTLLCLVALQLGCGEAVVGYVLLLLSYSELRPYLQGYSLVHGS